MTRERWQQVCDLLEQALELEPQQRLALLDRACGADPSLRKNVEVLLASSDRVRSSFLQGPPLAEQTSQTETETRDVLAPGAKLGPYLIRSLIGSGGMGEVYRARDTELKREVAIKVLPEFWSRDPERLHRFELEAQAAAALNHPNIISIHHVGRHDGSPYIVTELLQGETLRERLRRGPVPLRKTIEYAVQIANGLAAAHDRGIVHRDLKPENLFVTKDGRVKILDFGLARLVPSKEASGEELTVTQRTGSGVVLGTAGYMSPEQVRGKTVDHRADIFAFGTILYEMVTGRQPFRKSTSAETMTAILNEEPPSISQITPAASPGMQRVVHRCLEKDPEQRFHSAHDLAFALDALADSTITTPSGSHAKQGKGWSRRQIAVVTTTALVLIVASALAYLWLRPEPVPRLSNYVQLTHDGWPKGLIGTDGSRIYLGVASPDYRGVAVIPTSGGEPKPVLGMPKEGLMYLALSPDVSELIVGDTNAGLNWEFPLWIYPIISGSPRRLGNFSGASADWSPDRKLIAFADRNTIFIVKPDGSESRKVVALGETDFISDLIWSPDQSHLRFTRSQNPGSPAQFWEVKLDGTGLHQLLPGWSKDSEYECCGSWTIDGKYFLFQSRGQIWALPQKRSYFHSPPAPIQLTASPVELDFVPSRDGKKLFVLGKKLRGELTRYDLKSGRFEPYLGGISADNVSFSKDGQWFAYVSYPDGTVWRSRLDGTDKFQLTYPEASWSYSFNPRWSPDGKKIAFCQIYRDKPPRMFEVSSEGGSPQPLLPEDNEAQVDPDWSPDGNKIVFSGNGRDPTSSIHILDMTTHQLSTLPGSQGMFSSRWSPEGRYIASLSADSKRLLLFDFQTQKWTEIANSSGEGLGWQRFSDDGHFLQFVDGITRAVLRFHLSNHKIERIVDLKDFEPAGYWHGWSLAIASDNSPLLLRNAGTSDVYSLDWEER